MKSVLCFILFSLLLSQKALAQDIFIYHAKDKSTSIVESSGNLASTSSNTEGEFVIVREANKVVKIRIINPNTVIYDYEINSEKLDVSEELPDLTLFSTAFNAMLSQASSAKAGGIGKINGNSVINDTEFEAYIEAIKAIGESFKSVDRIIKDSDTPESIPAAIKNENSGGIRRAKERINEIEGGTAQFNSPTLLADLTELSNSSTSNVFLRKIFDVFNADLVTKVNKIKDVIVKAPTSLTKEFKMTNDTYKLKLVVKVKPDYEKIAFRDKDEIDLNLVVKPLFNRPFIELLPVATVAFASDVPEYSIEDGLITQRNKDDFRFGAGSLLLFNAIKFGQMKEGALGAGIGFSIPKSGNILNSLYVSSLISYRQFLRFGVGVGFTEFSNGLEGANVGHPLPESVANIEDIVKYERRLACFLSLSFVGLKISE